MSLVPVELDIPKIGFCVRKLVWPSQNGFARLSPKKRVVTMGYSNKRRRCKRKRARTLNAMQSNRISQNRSSSSDESSLDIRHHSTSSSTSFCSTHSHHSFMLLENHKIPDNISLDDVNIIPTRDCHNNETQFHFTEDEQSSIANTENIDEALQNFHEEMQHDAAEDDVTVHSTMSSLDDTNNTDTNGNFNQSFAYHQQHRFDLMTREETASYKIMSLLDDAGAPRICYDRLVALLKKLSKTGFDVQKTINRETLMQRLSRMYKAQPRIQTCLINKQEVFRFTFQDMLQDLLHGCSRHLHHITPNMEWSNTETGSVHELWNTPWMRNTFTTEEYSNFDSEKDVMLPIILYMDKTGTDVNQRYSLEPVLFSLAAIPREKRESRHSWRHLGFVPQKQSSSEDESDSSLQFYHDCLSYLLDGLREAQKNPPTVTMKSHLDIVIQRRALLPLMVVMGDQLSQDTLCGRLKSNSGGAGRVHRSCMCSYLNIDDPYHECRTVDTSTLNLLTTNATITEDEMDFKINSSPTLSANTKDGRISKSFLLKQRTMFRSVLRHPFTTHPIKNAFTGINFGSWSAGIHEATLDDFMHSVEAGMVAYITETVYDGLTKKEKESIEEMTRPMLNNQRCSIVSTYPRWRLQAGFTRQTLMTSGERVGSILALSLSLQDPKISETIRQGHYRQIQKYLDLSTELPDEKKMRESDPKACDAAKKSSMSSPPPEFFLDQHMHMMEDHAIRHTLEHMIRHGFQVTLLDQLDPFQVNQMMWQCADIFKTTQYPKHYPSEDIADSYADLGEDVTIPKEQFRQAKFALQTQPSKLFKSHRYRKVDGTAGKHFKRKANKKGEGSSAAVLSTNMGTLNIFLEYVLCYHAFCKYSWTLPVFLQRSFENISAGNRFVVEYFQKLIYRGNASIDSCFPKIHAQCRMGKNTERLNTVMNFCCETGERLLKTEAKGISRTAQQRGSTTFLSQTMLRLKDRTVLDCFAMYLEDAEKGNHDKETLDLNPCDRFSRTCPHFVCDIEKAHICSVNRKNEQSIPNSTSGTLTSEIIDALKKHEPQMKQIEIFNEVVLRDNSRVRASPNYAKTGPWYDYANVSWERTNEEGVVESYLLPAKCICFYRKLCCENGAHEIMALVHTVDQLSIGKVPGRTDTLLTRHYHMQYDAKGKPATHVVPVASIDSSIRCFPHVPSGRLFDCDSPGIMYLLPRNHWAYMWMAVNDALMESNSNNRVKHRKGKLISLCSIQWLESVRHRYSKYLGATCIEDL